MSDFAELNFQRLKGIVRQPWSIGTVSYVAVGIGAIAPLMNLPLFLFCPTRAVPFAFASLMAFWLVLLYWKTDRTKFRTDLRARIATFLSGLAWILGIVGLAWCYSHHICMAGHMDHPPYPVWHYVADLGWILCLVGATIWTRLELVPICIAFAAINTFLVSYRFLFGSFGGIYDPLPL
jgi:hypothetical protein